MILFLLFLILLVVLFLAATAFASTYSIGPTQVGLVRKRFGTKLPGDNPVAFLGEAGYQADLLMPGLRFKFKPFYAVTKHPWVQVPAGTDWRCHRAGRQAHCPSAPSRRGTIPLSATSPICVPLLQRMAKRAFNGLFSLPALWRRFIRSHSSSSPSPRSSACPCPPNTRKLATGGKLDFRAFGLEDWQLDVTRIAPKPTGDSGKVVDMIGVVTALDGEPLPAGAIASRLGEFKDVSELEAKARRHRF